MLTTTYSIMLLHGEQQKARSLVSGLERHLDLEACNGFDGGDVGWIKQAFVKLVAAYTFCRERKIERYVIPTVRDAASDAQPLFASLEFYAAHSGRIVEYAHAQVQRAIKGIQVDVAALAATMQLYCKQMMECLLLEEESLFPLACRLLSEDEWFAIASQCLSHGRKARCKCYHIHTLGRRRLDQRHLH